MNNPALSRRQFLGTSGSIAVAFTLIPDFVGNLAAAAAGGPPSLTVIPPAATVPYADSVCWLILDTDSITIRSGRVELGTGVRTAMTQIALDELHLSLDNTITYVQGDTRLTADEGTTAGSKSIQRGGPLMRAAAATLFQELLARAASKLKVSPSQLTASGGRFQVVGSNKQATYQSLLKQPSTVLVALATPPVRDTSTYELVGQPVARQDLADKIFCAPTAYVQDVRLPGMLHARVIRPTGRNDTFGSFEAASLVTAAAIPGFVQTVQQGSFVAVVAATEWGAITASTARLGGVKVNWIDGPALLPEASLPTALKHPANIYGTNEEVHFPGGAAGFDAAYAAADVTVEAEYFSPFQMHAPFGPSCAVADVKSEPDPATGVQARVWSHTQGVYPLRRALSGLLGLGETAVHVTYAESAGCYGHDGADDVAGDAALISKIVGKPVRVQWMRQDEHGWEPLGSAMVHKLRGGVAAGTITSWDHTVYSATHNSRPSGFNSGSLIAGMLANAGTLAGMPATLGSATGRNTNTRNAPVTYTFPNRLTSNSVRSFETVNSAGGANATNDRTPSAPLTWRLPRTTALRSLGGFSNSFSNESFMGELAAAAGADDLAFRLTHLDDPRAIAVMQALQPAWDARPVDIDGVGAGVAFERYETVETYVAAYVEVHVDRTTGVIAVKRVVVAHDCGLIINPDGLRNQIEGNVIQGISRTLKEEVHFNAKGVTSTIWERNPQFFVFTPQYPVIKFNETPVTIETVLLNHPETVEAWGAGEPTIGVIGGAIGNAVFHAVGVRMRSLPMLPSKVLAAL